MRFVPPFVAALVLVAGLVACSGKQAAPSDPRAPSQPPTVTLTEPAGGPTRAP
ncbi:hypothetical protein ACQPZU_21535 [Saccharomonospora azurea]|uniref:hypothetical protein n=1 Tax=Saccharomonospora azurea TaxID=40988 RepID=UPI0002E03685|nr:hypothetical protein [Saccharomonospora azurea]